MKNNKVREVGMVGYNFLKGGQLMPCVRADI